MSSFLTNFSSYFSEEERESELYRILSTIGVNFEKVILEELNAEIRRSTEASVFSENKIRSLLAFLLTPVRNVISASGFGRVVVNSIEHSNQTFVSVPEGRLINGFNGKEYQIQSDLMLNLGCSTSFSFIQGVESSFTGVYSEFIAIPIAGGAVDLSRVRVSMFVGSKWVYVPLVSFFPKFPVELRSLFSSLGSSLTGFVGDTEQDSFLLSSVLRDMEALWDTVHSTSIRPRSGFFPFFFNDTLFIKIFSGGVQGSSDFIPDPSGSSVLVHYRISDGSLGNLGKNQLKSFVSALETEDGGQVNVTLYNDEVFNGVNAPSRAELVSLLRKRFFASSHVSSIPEYTAWFLAQPFIGDCLVVSDFERWSLSGKSSVSGSDIKGTVDVYLVDTLGNPILPKDGLAYSSLIKSLDAELSTVKDVSFLNYLLPLVYWHFYVVQYRSVFSDVAFTSNALDVLFNLYSISWVRDNESSLFRDLDIDYVTNVIRGDFGVSGLMVTPFHYFEYSNLAFDVSSNVVLIRSYYGEKPGGWYEYWEKDFNGDLGYFVRDSDGNLSFDEDGVVTNDFVKGIPCAVYREYVDLSGFCYIFRYGMVLTGGINGEQGGWSWSDLWSSPDSSKVGDRVGVDIRLNLANMAPGVLRCFWCLANDGLISVGGDVLVGDFGIRKLPSEHSLLLGQTFFGEFLRFEKH